MAAAGANALLPAILHSMHNNSFHHITRTVHITTAMVILAFYWDEHNVLPPDVVKGARCLYINIYHLCIILPIVCFILKYDSKIITTAKAQRITNRG